MKNEFLNYLKYSGVVAGRTYICTPQQNGRADRMNRTLLEMICVMLQTKNDLKEF